MKKDRRLEELSDKVRQGIPISMAEAIETIEYQEIFRNEREAMTYWRKLIGWIKCPNK